MNISLIIFVLVFCAQDTYTKKYYTKVPPSSIWQLDNSLEESNSIKQAPTYLLMLKGLPRYPHLKTLFPNLSLVKLKGKGKKSRGKKPKRPPKKAPSKPHNKYFETLPLWPIMELKGRGRLKYSTKPKRPNIDVTVEVTIPSREENNQQ